MGPVSGGADASAFHPFGAEPEPGWGYEGCLYVGWGYEGWVSCSRGMVIFNQAREVLMAQGIQFPMITDPMVVELLVLREAMLWCLALGFTEVGFEGDAKVIIDKINRADTRDNRIGDVLEEVVHYFALHPGFRVRFVGRRSNRVAHSVASPLLYPTTSRSFGFMIWLNSRV
ncbi:unnamed protein product [Linum trigynum]|uniref:RNase H type-1 domain-containing protein n=1 Tax=Linum trigynum TaxID=586398 RepID=A0AAV2CIP9_9ROSI